MKKILPLLIIGLLSCSDPVQKNYSEDKFEEDLVELKSRLDTTDKQMLVGTILRYSMQGKKEELPMMTYEEIINDGKAWKAEQDRIEAEQKVLAEKARKDEEDRITRLGQALTVSCFDKGFTKYNYQEYITYKFAFENKTDKDITAFTGMIIFNDLFDKEITKFSMTYDESVPSGQRKTWNTGTDYNQFKNNDVAMKNKSLDKMKMIWKPEKILFTDGSTLE